MIYYMLLYILLNKDLGTFVGFPFDTSMTSTSDPSEWQPRQQWSSFSVSVSPVGLQFPKATACRSSFASC